MKKILFLFLCSLFLTSKLVSMEEEKKNELAINEIDITLSIPSFFWFDAPVTLPNEKDVEDYHKNPKLHRWCTKKEYDDIATSIIDGGSIVFALQHAQIPETKTNQCHLAQLKNICWFVYSLDPKWNNGIVVFKEKKQDGMMPLWNHFYSYFLKTTDDEHKIPVLKSTNPWSYARYSSHFSKSQKAGKVQIGIDSRKTADDWEDYDLPHGCSTMLCGELEESENDKSNEYGRWFLKPEKYGLCGALKCLQHAKGFAGSVCRKVLPKLVGRTVGEFIAGSNDEACHRKEHLPLDILEAYQKICSENNIALQNIESIGQLIQIIKESNCATLEKLAYNIRLHYSYPDERFGNEVYLTDQELCGPSLYCWLAKRDALYQKEVLALTRNNMKLLSDIKGRSRTETFLYQGIDENNIQLNGYKRRALLIEEKSSATQREISPLLTVKSKDLRSTQPNNNLNDSEDGDLKF